MLRFFFCLLCLPMQTLLANKFEAISNVVLAPSKFILLCSKAEKLKTFEIDFDPQIERTPSCPAGWNLLAYVLLRQGFRYIYKKIGPVQASEIIKSARSVAFRDTLRPLGQTLIINLDEKQKSVF